MIGDRLDPEALHRSPNRLAEHYRRFRVAERHLLTGHSHQAWPDRGFEAQQRAWLDAAEHVDAKWDRAFEMADRVRAGFARLLGDGDGHITLGANTHELVTRLLSGLPLRSRPRLVTTDGEFHTIRRQLDRVMEEGIEVVRVPALPVSGTAERLVTAVDDRTAAVLVSSVLFQSGQIVPGLARVQAACDRHGAVLLVDAYHSLNVVPFSIRDQGLEAAYVVGGGYKYCQLGEGNCFLRAPRDCRLRSVLTGWFSEFGELADDHADGPVAYGAGPNRFAGATYDPTSHYRAAAVFDFFEEQGLGVDLLREVSRHQVALLARAFDALDLNPDLITRERSIDLGGIGGFLVLRARAAADISARLEARGVLTDARGSSLRLGPAPYLADRQLTDAMGILGDVVREM